MDAESARNGEPTPSRYSGQRPILIGVAGGSGSGKTTFARMLQENIGTTQCGIILQDSYYFDQSENFSGDGSINYDDPSALEFSLLASHLKRLVGGDSVQIPIYDFSTHRRSSRFLHQAPKPVMVVDGILILSQESIVECLDYTVFVDAREAVRFDRRLQRDVAERGRTAAGVKAQFEAHVKPMHDQFVEPSKKVANAIVSGEHSFADSLVRVLREVGLQPNRD